MKQERNPVVGDMLVTAPGEASLRLQLTDLLLGGLRNARAGGSTREQSDVLQQIEAALEAYGSYLYPKERR